MRGLKSTVLAGCLGGMLAATSASGEVVYFQQGLSNDFVANYAGTSDTSFNSHASAGYGSGNMGGADFFWSNQTTTWEERKALIRFDLAALSGQDIEVNSATLILRPIGNASPDNVQVSFHAISAANAGWQQGTNTGVGVDASPGSATWNEKVFQTTPWAGSPGLNTPGVDYDPAAAATGVYDPTTTADANFVLPAALVQSWIDNPSANAGLVMLTDNNPANGYYRFAEYFSSEVGNSSLRPTLALDVTRVPEPAAMGLAAMIGAALLGGRRRS